MTMPRRTHFGVITAVLVLAAGGCAGNKVTVGSEYDPAAPFSLYRTYAWKGDPQVECYGPRLDIPLLQWRMRTTVDGDLAAKGYGLDPVRPDLRISVRLKCQRRTTDSIGAYIDYRDTGGRQGPSEAFVLGYEEGIFVFTIDDAGTGQMVWRGTASVVIEDGLDDNRIAEVMRQVLARFPRVGAPMPVPTAGS